MNWQTIVVVALVFLAFSYLLRSAYLAFRQGRCNGCDNCGISKPMASSFGGKPLIQLGRGPKR